MKKFVSILFAGFLVLTLCGCNNNTTISNTTQKVEEQVQQRTLSVASPAFQKGLQSLLNSGYKIAPGTSVYYVKSKDYENVYFFGALVEKNGQYYNSIWATNDMSSCGAGLVFSMNDYAIQSSGMGDGRTNSNPMSESDDGYSDVNNKILNLMDSFVNKG